MKKLTTVVVGAILLSGCSTEHALVSDLSKGDVQARIQNVMHNARFDYPVFADAIVVDPGPVMVFSQYSGGPASALHGLTGGALGHGRGNKMRTQAFYVLAEAGHTYEVRDGCLYLKDANGVAVNQVLSCQPYLRGIARTNGISWSLAGQCCADDQNGPRATQGAFIIYSGTTQYQDTCWPSAGSGEGYTKSVVVGVPAGRTTLDASCDNHKTASFDFDAQSKHMYTLSADDKDCMRLLDITTKEIVIACEPYH